MDDKIQTAVIFTANVLESRNIVFLTPQKIVIGEYTSDDSYFYSYLDGEEYSNMDEVILEQTDIGFYNVKTIGSLKEKYGVDDLYTLFNNYMNDLYTQVYYYELGHEPNMENYFMKRCSIAEFNEKFNLKFSYDRSGEEEIEEEQDPISENFKSIKECLDKNLLFQNNSKDKLINTLYNNCISKSNKSNIIIYGPTGVGKTEMLRSLSNSSCKPVLYTKYAPDLIEDVEEYLNELLRGVHYASLSKDDKNSPIIIIDDFDKDFDYVKSMHVLDALAKFVKNGKRFVPYESGSRQGLIFDSENITFIICGNFEYVKSEKNIPLEFFSNNGVNYSDISASLNKKELIDSYGFSKEILDSFKVHIGFEPLTFSKAKKILVNSNNSPFNIYRRQLKEQGISVNISDETIDLICKKVYSKKNNIKNIDTVVSDIFKHIIVDSISIEEPAEVTIDGQTIADHKKYSIKKSSKK